MNLAQYRLKAAAQNRKHLWLCLTAAGMLHVGAIALTHPPTSRHTPPDPIQFMAIDQPDSLPASSNILANSISRPVQTTPQVVSAFTGITRSHSSLSISQTKLPSQVTSPPKPATAKDEVWGTYLAALRQQIYQQWQVKLQVKTNRPTKVRFVVDRQGHLTDLELIQSSSDATVDRGALKAVQVAAPFAQLPIASKEDRLRVTFTFEAPAFHE
jgi:TonB family protein